MAERVVDVLEAVEVETEYGHEIAVALGAGHGAVEMLVELNPVGQAGQGIVHGEIADLILGQPALADASRSNGRGHREAHHDQQAGGQRHHRESQIGEAGSGRLVEGKGVDAGDLAVFGGRDESEPAVARA